MYLFIVEKITPANRRKAWATLKVFSELWLLKINSLFKAGQNYLLCIIIIYHELSCVGSDRDKLSYSLNCANTQYQGSENDAKAERWHWSTPTVNFCKMSVHLIQFYLYSDK